MWKATARRASARAKQRASPPQPRAAQVNGAANAAAIAAAKAAGVPRFAYVSAHVPALPGFDYVMEGYVKGKQQAEQELFKEYPEGEGQRACVAAGVRVCVQASLAPLCRARRPRCAAPANACCRASGPHEAPSSL